MNAPSTPYRPPAAPTPLSRSTSLVVAVDLQAKLAPAIHEIDRVAHNACRLLRAAATLGVPSLVTEQYPKGLGTSVPAVIEAAGPGAELVEKIHFGACAEPKMQQSLARHGSNGRQVAVIFGTETHVCVLQTAFGLLAAGWSVALVVDACGSRTVLDKQTGIDRLTQAGATAVTTEMVLFEWLERADTDDFRALLPVIRDGQPP